MRISLKIGFHPDAATVTALLPSSLRHLASHIRDASGGHSHRSVCDLSSVDPAVVPYLAAWGRTLHREKTIIRTLRIYETYGWADLAHLPFVEVYATPHPNSFGLTVANYPEVFSARRQCGACLRADWTQTDDLEIPEEELEDAEYLGEIEFIERADWIVSSRVQGLLSGPGISWRPIKNVSDRAQLEVHNVCTVLPLPPLGFFVLCAECGRPCSVVRNDIAEGPLLGFSDDVSLTLSREMPITVQIPADADWLLARTDIPIESNQPNSPEGFGAVGEMISLGENYAGFERRLYVMATSLARRLMDAGVSGIAFRPLILVRPAEEPAKGT